MAHSHEHHSHDHCATSTSSDHELSTDRQHILNRLRIAILLCCIFLIVEVIGGLWSKSLAILSDAAHLLSDVASFAVAIMAHYIANIPSTINHTFGLKRSESLAALLSMISLAFICVWLGAQATQRLFLMVQDYEQAIQTYNTDGRIMSIVAAIGVAVNICLALVLGEHHVHMAGSSHEHDHHHEHAHSSEISSLLEPEHVDEVDNHPEEPHERNVNLHAAYLHVLGDLAQSVAVLLAGIVIYCRPRWVVVDPLLTLTFCILVFYSTLSVVRSSVAVLLEGVPPSISYTQVVNDLKEIPHLSSLHDVHIWSISDGEPSISLHASVEDASQLTPTLEHIKRICQTYKIDHITAQIQPLRIVAGCDHCLTCTESNLGCY